MTDLIPRVDLGLGGQGQLGARGGGAGHRRRVPAAVRSSGSPDFANSGAPVAKSTGLWVWRDQRVMRDLPGAKAGLEGALGCARGGGGGSTRWRTPACACSRSSGHRKGCKRGRARARSKGKPKQGDEAAVQCCRELATVEQWRRSAGVRVLAARVGYDLPNLAQ
jgi:hypothetical protein